MKYMSKVLTAFQLDIQELLDDLSYEWQQRETSKYNPYAFSKAKPTGTNIMICCPVHAETNPSCGVTIDAPYGWNCFGCGASGNLYTLVMTALDLKGEFQAEHYIMKNYINVTVQKRKPIDLESIFDGHALDRKRSLFEGDVVKFTQKRHSYIQRRGFSEHSIQKYELGYDEESRALTFPVRTSKGLIRFIKKRFVDRKGFLNESGIDKKDIVYGLYYLLQAPKPILEIYLNESETDTVSCYEAKLPAGAILGRLLFKEQVRELVKAGIKTVNLFFDNDKAGVQATLNAYQMLSNMSAIRINVVIYPEGHWGINGTGDMLFKDANHLLLQGKMDAIKLVTFDDFLSQLDKSALEMDELDWLFI